MPVNNSIVVRLLLLMVGSMALSLAGCRSVASWPGMSWIDKNEEGARYAYAEPDVDLPNLPPPGERANNDSSNVEGALVGYEDQVYPSTNTPDAIHPESQSGYLDGSYNPNPSPPEDSASSVAEAQGYGGTGQSQQGFFDPNYQDPAASENAYPSGGGYHAMAETPHTETPRYDGSGHGTFPTGTQSNTYGNSTYGSNSSTYGTSQPRPNPYASDPQRNTSSSLYQGRDSRSSNTSGAASATSLPESSGYSLGTSASPYPSTDSGTYSSPTPNHATYPSTGDAMVQPGSSGSGASGRSDAPYQPAGTTRYQGLEGLRPSPSNYNSPSSGPQSHVPYEPGPSPSTNRSWDATPPPAQPSLTPTSHYQMKTSAMPSRNNPVSSHLSLA